MCTSLSAFLLIYFASYVSMIMAGRSLAGFSIGIASLALPVYLGETVEARVRGTLGLLPTTLGNLGNLENFVPSDCVFLDIEDRMKYLKTLILKITGIYKLNNYLFRYFTRFYRWNIP